jgi:hypothetical protein
VLGSRHFLTTVFRKVELEANGFNDKVANNHCGTRILKLLGFINTSNSKLSQTDIVTAVEGMNSLCDAGIAAGVDNISHDFCMQW